MLYGIGYWLVSRGKGHTALIFGAGFVFCAELVWAYPATAVDVFGYVAHGRLLALHSVNPFTVVPAEFPGDAIMPYLAFPTEPSQYGPIWVLIGVVRRRPARAFEGTLLAVALAAVIYRPFWEGLNTLTALRRTDLFTASLGSVLRLSLMPGLGSSEATAIARWVSLGGFGAVALGSLWLARRARSSQGAPPLASFALLRGL